MATAPSAGRASGSAIRQNDAEAARARRPGPPPPARPGSAMKNCRMMNVASTLGAPKIGTRISGQWVSTMPQLEEHLEQRHDRHLARDQQAGEDDQEQHVGPGKRMRAKAYPASDATAMRADGDDRPRCRGCSVLLRERLQLEHLAGTRRSRRWSGSSFGGKAKMSPIGFTDEVTIHQVGNTNGTASTQQQPVEHELGAADSSRLMEDPPPAHLPLQRRSAASTITNSRIDSVAP